MSWITQSEKGVTVTLQVLPRASRTEIQGLQGDVLKIKLRAAPLDGKANKELIKFLSKKLKIPASGIVLTSGKTTRKKRLRITGAGLNELRAKLLPDVT